jgi:hypothetical protein
MKNWAVLSLLYDLHPSPYNYIKFKYYYFHFCRRDDPTIIASLYLDNLAGEIKNNIAKESSVNKKSLTLAVIKKILENNEAKQEFVALLEKQPTAINDEIKQFLDRVSALIHNLSSEKEQITVKEEIQPVAVLPARAYVIATHMYLELNNNELHYETLIRDTTALKEFITYRFKAGKISGRIADMKNFSYKKILSGKNNTGAKGQLLPQIEQIAANPEIFGADVSAFAGNILEEYTQKKGWKTL